MDYFWHDDLFWNDHKGILVRLEKNGKFLSDQRILFRTYEGTVFRSELH